MAQLTDWLYDALKNSDLGRRADENRNRRQQGAGPAVSIPGVDWAALDASRSPLGSALGATTRAPYGVAGQDPFAAPFPTEGQEYFAPTSSRFDPFLMMGMATPQVPQPRSDLLTTRSVATIPVDRDGNPIITAPQQSGARPAVTQGVQPAGTVTMPPGARPSNIPLPSMPPPSTLSAAWDPFNTINPNADQSRLPPNDGGEAGFMAAFYPNAQNPAVGAIDQATGMPRPRPGFVQPFTPSPMLRSSLVPTGETLPGATNFDGSPVEITVRGGSKQNPPPVPMPRFVNNRGQAVTPQMGTFYNPDTNKFEQRQVFRPAPSGKGVPAVPLPRRRPPVNRSKNVSGPPVGMTVDEVGAFRYHG